LQLNLKRSPQVPQWINTDEPKLRQILINLLSNAIKFINRGAVTLAVEVNNLQIDNLQKTTADQFNLIFVVEDTDEGIPDNELERIFEPFEQTALGRKASEGTGLGLSISSKFAQLMGGKITVSSILGEGSIFEVNLPAIKPINIPVSRLVQAS
jgi:signal transduction histidine kinase